MREYKYILVDGEPVPEPDVIKWSNWFQDHNEERILKQDRIGSFFVSTVFLALAFDGMGDPCWDRHQRRYATRQEAEKGHEEAVRMVKEGKFS